MAGKPSKRKRPRHCIGEEKLAAGLEKTLEGKYGKVLEAAKRKWEREFGAKKDPSDATVRVRVSRPHDI
ncbi:MAG TPA: hypothetical protein VF683_00205 [Chthoniobacterales bacterium]